MAKIFITGISSSLMRQFAESLLDHEIFGLSRKEIALPNVKILKGDIMFPESWQDVLLTSDIIIHAAAVTHCFTEKEYYDTNYEGTVRIVSIAKTNKNTRFVYISTRTACKNSGGYGESKLAAEDFIKANIDNYLIIRPAEIFGGLKNEGIDKIIQGATQKKIMACPVQLYAPLVPIHVTDVNFLMKKYIFDPETKNETITLNGPDRYTVYELIKFVNICADHKTFVLPIPKAFMYLIKNAFKFIGLNIGFVPDQVDRLYCKKEISNIPHNYFSLSRFIKERAV